MSEEQLEAKVKELEAKVKALERKLHPEPVELDTTLVLCTWASAPIGAGMKCGWTGPAFSYQDHLDQKHGGKEYKEPKVGLPARRD